MMTDEEVLIVCDGSSRRYASGERRAAAVAVVKRGSEVAIFGEYLGPATNQQAEIVAACVGLEALASPSSVRVLTDSEYVVRTMQGLYQRRANHAFWDRLDRAARPHVITWVWIPKRAGHHAAGDVRSCRAAHLEGRARGSGALTRACGTRVLPNRRDRPISAVGIARFKEVGLTQLG
jgi:ribonuclease HI